MLKLNIWINSLRETTSNTFTSTQATPHSTKKTNRVESETQMPQTSKNNLKKEEEDARIIMKLLKNAGCTSNNVGAPSITLLIPLYMS